MPLERIFGFLRYASFHSFCFLEFECLNLLNFQAFLQSVPTSSDSNQKLKWSSSPIQFLTCEGRPVTATKVVNGVLLEAPELPTYTHNTTVVNLKVALYNISMAGDTDEWIDGVTPVAVDGMERDDLNKGVLDMMKGVVSMLVKEGVGLVACQKVIHPALKRFLKEQLSTYFTNVIKYVIINYVIINYVIIIINYVIINYVIIIINYIIINIIINFVINTIINVINYVIINYIINTIINVIITIADIIATIIINVINYVINTIINVIITVADIIATIIIINNNIIIIVVAPHHILSLP
ncbi:hypothetical protein QZH41_011177, partial [Actinostola sp. cb2023]